MQNISSNKKVLNLSQKNSKEISEFLQAILSLRHDLLKKGMKLEIKVKKRQKQKQ